jgi:hypothetical protein
MNKKDKQESELMPLLAQKADWKESKDDLSFDDIHGLISRALMKEYHVENSYECPCYVYKLWTDKVVVKRSYGSSAKEHCLFKMFSYSIKWDEDEDEKAEAELSDPVEVNQMFVPVGSEPANGFLAVREADELSTDDPEFVRSLVEEDEDQDTPQVVVESALHEAVEEQELRERGEFKTDFFETPLKEARIEQITEGGRVRYVLRNVSMLSEQSKNGRTYSGQVQEEAVPIFEGIKAYADHPTKANENEPRRIKETIGRYKNVRFVGAVKMTYGDLFLARTKLVNDYIIPIAESDPSLIGSSINAFGRMDSKGNVEKITRAQSVDLVTEPATTKGLYESVTIRESKTTEKGEEAMTLEEVLKDEALMDKLRSHIHEELDLVASYEEKDEQIKKLAEQIKTIEKDQADKLKALEEENTKLRLADKLKNTEAEITSLLAESKLPEEAKKELRPLLDKASDAEERKGLVKRMEDMVEGIRKGVKPSAPSVHTENKVGEGKLSDKDLTVKVFENFRSRQR